MALTQITYTNKETLNEQPSIADKNKVTADNMNEIKSVVNNGITTIDGIINGEVYSTSEVKTNKVWIDGKPIYRKTFQFTTVNNTSWTLLENNNYEYVIDINGEIFSNEHYIGITKYLNFYRLNGNLYYQCVSSFSQEKQVTFWIEYTKTTD